MRYMSIRRGLYKFDSLRGHITSTDTIIRVKRGLCWSYIVKIIIFIRLVQKYMLSHCNNINEEKESSEGHK